MSSGDLAELWRIARENEKNLAVLQAQLGVHCEAVKRLREDTEALKGILNRALGAKTAAGMFGAVIGAAVTWFIAIFFGGR